MNEPRDDLIKKTYESIQRIHGLGMNTPNVILWNDEPVNNRAREMNMAVAQSLVYRLKHKVLLPGFAEYQFLTPKEYTEKIQEYIGGPLLVLRSTKSNPLVTGYCIPSPYWIKIKIEDTEHSIIWGQSVDLPFPVGMRRPILDLVSMIQRGRLELDGSRIRFTFHSRGEGLLGDRIVLWGYSSEDK